MPPALQVEGLRAAYGGGEVLRGISLTMAQGTMLGVAGPNGGGKSTLLRTVTGLLQPSEGRVEILGRDAANLPARERARLVAVVPQIEVPLWDFTVGAMITHGRHPHRALLAPLSAADRAAVARAARRTDVLGLMDRRVGALSGGEWQRVLLARALAQEAPLLLLDEPAAHLDPGHRWDLHRILRELVTEEGRSVLCVSHDLNLAAQHCDRLLLLGGGVVTAAGTPAEVMNEQVLQETFQCAALRVARNPHTGHPGTVFAP